MSAPKAVSKVKKGLLAMGCSVYDIRLLEASAVE